MRSGRPGPTRGRGGPRGRAPSGSTWPPTTAPTAAAATQAVERGPGRARHRAGPHRVAVRRRAGAGPQPGRRALPGLHPVRPGLGRARLARPGRRARRRRLADPARRRGPAGGRLARRARRPAGGRGGGAGALGGVRRGAARRLRRRPRPAGPRRHLAGSPPHLRWGEIHPRTLLADLGRRTQRRRGVVPLRARLAGVLRRRPLPPARLRARVPPARASPGWSTTTRATGSRPGRPGRTGFPIVDAGMRQLLATGWMHNRVRMIVASFLVKDLHLEWQHGARHFMQHLVDGDLASNQHGWQWVAGSGTDAAPYFRVFNPITQGRKFDPDGAYVRRWVPELAPTPAEPARARRGGRLPRADRRPRRRAPRGAGALRDGSADDRPAWSRRGSAARRPRATAAGPPARWPRSLRRRRAGRGDAAPAAAAGHRAAGRRRSTGCWSPRPPTAPVAEAAPRCRGRALPVVEPVPAVLAASPRRRTPATATHPFPTCFSCGTGREPGDGLRIFPGMVAGRLARWPPPPGPRTRAVEPTPRPRPGQRARTRSTWAALDCVGGWSSRRRGAADGARADDGRVDERPRRRRARTSWSAQWLDQRGPQDAHRAAPSTPRTGGCSAERRARLDHRRPARLHLTRHLGRRVGWRPPRIAGCPM